MALPTIAVASAAIDSLYAIFSHKKTRPRNRFAVSLLTRLKPAVLEAYRSDVTVAITDSTDASPTAAFVAGGQVGLALGRAAAAGDIFTTSGGVNDFTDNALATAKGGAVATNDRFVVLSATTVGYLGGATEVSFSDEEEADFTSLGA